MHILCCGAVMQLSCAEQESCQRNRLGGGVEHKAYRSFLCHPAWYLAFEPPSPQTPLPAPVVSLAIIVFQLDNGKASDQAGWGT